MSEYPYISQDELLKSKYDALSYIPPEFRRYCVDEEWLLQQMQEEKARMGMYLSEESLDYLQRHAS